MEWNALPLASENAVEHLSKVLGISPVVAQLLAQRGVTTYEEAKTFLDPIGHNFTIRF
jgi:single-stranded-DNA-specific exonuclease